MFKEVSEPIHQVFSVTIYGTCYKKDPNTILLAEMKDVYPVFGSVVNIWLCSSYIFFALKLYDTVEYSSSLNAYQIEEESLPSSLFIVEVKDLLMYSVMHIYRHNGLMYVCPREDPNAIMEL